MEETQVFTFARFLSKMDRDKALFYINEDTRPNFEDDVPEGEAAYFNAVDERPYPENLILVDDHTLYLYYEIDELEPIIQCNELKADFTLTVCRSEYEGYDYKILLSKNGSEPNVIYSTDEYSEDERDEKFESFQMKLDGLSDFELIKFIFEYVNKGLPLP